MSALSWLLPAGVCLVLTLMALEAARWRRGALVISRRRFGLRMAMGGLLVVLLGAIFTGRFVLALTSPLRSDPNLFWSWWLCCLLLALALLYLGSVDMNELDATKAKHEQELWRRFAQGLARKEQPDDDQPKQDE